MIKDYKLLTIKGLDLLRLLTISLEEEGDNGMKLSDGLLHSIRRMIREQIILFWQVHLDEDFKSNTKED